MTDKIDPSALSGTELILRRAHCPETLFASSPEAATEAVTKEAPPADEVASEEHLAAFKAAMELLTAKERARKIVELAKQAKKDKKQQ